MNHNLETTGSITINSSPEMVWEGLTNPEIIKEYLFGTETLTDWKVGSPITFQGEYNGTTYTDKGIVVENIPFKKLSYNYWSTFYGTEDLPENYSLVKYFVEKLNDDSSKLTWHQKGFPDENGVKHSNDGMNEFMNLIKEVIERSSKQ